jgi:hypothetical protein
MASATQQRSILSVVLRLVIASTLVLGHVPGLMPVHPVGAQLEQLLTVTKTADNPIITAGEPIGFTITIASTGNGDASGVFLVDGLFPLSGPVWPETTWTETTGNPACIIDLGSLGCGFDTIPSGAPPIVLHITAPTTQQDCGTVANVVRVWTPEPFEGFDRSAYVTINCPTAPLPTDTPTPPQTATEPPLATPIAFVPTSTAAGPIAELPGTGGGPTSRSDRRDLWLLMTLLALSGLGLGGLRAKRAR